jgi:hypothetical protein
MLSHVKNLAVCGKTVEAVAPTTRELTEVGEVDNGPEIIDCSKVLKYLASCTWEEVAESVKQRHDCP